MNNEEQLIEDLKEMVKAIEAKKDLLTKYTSELIDINNSYSDELKVFVTENFSHPESLTLLVSYLKEKEGGSDNFIDVLEHLEKETGLMFDTNNRVFQFNMFQTIKEDIPQNLKDEFNSLISSVKAL